MKNFFESNKHLLYPYQRKYLFASNKIWLFYFGIIYHTLEKGVVKVNVPRTYLGIEQLNNIILDDNEGLIASIGRL